MDGKPKLITLEDEARERKIETLHNERAEKVLMGAKLADINDIRTVNILLKTRALHGAPQTPKELHDAIRITFGSYWPITATAEDANAPFDWISDVYFGHAERSFAIGARLSGKTYGASVLHYFPNTYKPGYTSRHAAANREQAAVAANYLREFAQDEIKATVFEGKPGNSEARWKNNGHYKIVTGSTAGVSGQHPIAAFWDEIEFWKIEAIEQTWYVPQRKNGWDKLWVAMSTRQRSFGAANWLSKNAAEKGVKIYKWTAFETMQRCRTCIAIDENPNGSDESRQRTCNLWEDCYGKRGTKSTGWVPLKDVQDVKRSLSKAAWRVQGVCDKPSSSGLVLANFDHEYRMEGGNYTHYAYQPGLPLYCAHDPAEGKKSCLFFIQIHEDNIYVFDESIIPECPNTSTAKKAMYDHCRKKGYADPVLIIVDPRRTDAIADWKAGTANGEGIGHRYKAVGSPTDKARGGQEVSQTIEYLRKAIQDGEGVRRLFVNPKQCEKLCTAIREFHYPTDMNNNVTSDKPADDYKDEIDPLRYFCQWWTHVYKTGNAEIFWLNG